MKRSTSGITAAGCIAATILFGSCSGDDGQEVDQAVDATVATVAPYPSPPLTTPTTLTVPRPPTTATPTSMVPSPTPTGDSTTSTTMMSFTGDRNSEWCTVAAQLIVLSDEFEAAPLSDPDEVEETFTAFVDRMALIAFIAPPEIVDDVALSVGAFGDMLVLFEAADFDLAAADLSTIDARRAPLEASSNRIATYNRDVCGLDPDSVAASDPTGVPGAAASTSTTFAPGTDSRRVAAIDLLTSSGYTTETAECIVDEIEKGLPTADVLTACGVSLDGSTP